jgi:hypothetical protein
VVSEAVAYAGYGSFAIAIAGGFMAVINFVSIFDLGVIIPAAVAAAHFFRRSGFFAERATWSYKRIEHVRRLHGKKSWEVAAKILRAFIWSFSAVFLVAASLIIGGFNRTLALQALTSSFGFLFLLSMIYAPISFLTGTHRVFIFTTEPTIKKSLPMP